MKVSGHHYGPHTPKIQRFSEPQSGTQAPEKGTLDLLLTGCVTLAESLNLFVPVSSLVKWGSRLHLHQRVAVRTE